MEELTLKKTTGIDIKNILNKLSELIIKEYTFWIYFLLSVMLKCIYFQYTTKINTGSLFSQTNFLMLLASFFILLIISSTILLFFNKRRLEAVFAYNIILSAILTCDTNFFRYYYSILTIPVIMQADIKLLSSIDDSIMSLFELKDIIYIIDIPIMLIWLIKLKKKSIQKIPLEKKLTAFLIILLIGCVGFMTIHGNTDTQAFVYSGNYVAKKLGVFYSHYDNTKKYIEENIVDENELTPEEKSYIIEYFKNQNQNSTSESSGNFRGIAKGKNLIVVQVEALQGFMINTEVNGKEITPNLNKLIKESLYFDNMYYQIAGGNTSDAEFLVNTSLFPAREGSVYVRFPNNLYYSLPKALKAQGYNTYALHAFTAQFWNREEMYKALEFDKFINSDYYVQDEFAGWEGNALSDSSFFRQSFDNIDTTEPFYSFFITLSSHYPFTYFEDYDFDVGEWQGTLLGNFIKAINYADKCLGEFIDILKERGLYDNSLLVIYGDHSGIPKHMADELMQFLGIEYSEVEWLRLQKVPCIMYYPGLKNGERVSIIAGQIDILPTIANLMDFDVPYALGRDLLNTDREYVILRNGNIVTDEYVYLNELGEVYSIKGGKAIKVNRKNYEKDIKTLLEKLNISDIIIEKDALRYIESQQ